MGGIKCITYFLCFKSTRKKRYKTGRKRTELPNYTDKLNIMDNVEDIKEGVFKKKNKKRGFIK